MDRKHPPATAAMVGVVAATCLAGCYVSRQELATEAWDRDPGSDAPVWDHGLDAGDVELSDRRDADGRPDVEDHALADDDGPEEDADAPEAPEAIDGSEADGGPDDSGDDAGCTWTGEYLHDDSGTCVLRGTDRADVTAPEECCIYRPCLYGCGPCIPLDECPPLYRELLRWCPCATGGEPEASVDPFVCDPPAQPGDVLAHVDEPWTDDFDAYAEIAARFCFTWWDGGDGEGPAYPPGRDYVLVRGFFGCPWHIAADLEALPSVQEASVGVEDDWPRPAPACP
ncbi:MAG: hypothetical protein HY905_24130 [Deltaproteobacteria bacterium]|nr:hypothetical protein [Deltaproteobacteria bacterium]